MTMPPLTRQRIRRKLQKEYALIKARIAVAFNLTAPQRLIFGHVDDTIWLDLNTAGYRRHAILRKILPSLPPEDVQIRFIGSAGDTALGEAYRAYLLFKELARRHGRPIGPHSRVLDFGAGWGRTLRFFMCDVQIENLLGVDVMEKAVALARENNPWVRFEQVSPLPPSDLPGSTLDLIYLYSVFSHLSEEAHDRWLTEFARILRPGGILIATTWDRQYIERCERARQGDTCGTHPGSLRAFPGTAEWLGSYDRGEFCHSPVGGGVLSTSFYGETCISEAYVRRRWTDRFEICAFLEADHRERLQSVIVARKP